MSFERLGKRKLAGRGPDMVYGYSGGVAFGIALVCGFDFVTLDLVIGADDWT